MDVLRSLPLTGFQVVTGEVLASGLLLLVCEFLAAVAAVWFSGSIWPQPWSERLSAAIGVMEVLPGISLLGILIQNAAALLFPSWIGTGEARVRGLEATGQRLLTVAGTLLVLVMGMIPAAVVSGIVLLIAWTSFGFYAIPIAGALAGAMLLVEFYIGLLGLGRLFDGYDVADPV
jgi:hypothetical protein